MLPSRGAASAAISRRAPRVVARSADRRKSAEDGSEVRSHLMLPLGCLAIQELADCACGGRQKRVALDPQVVNGEVLEFR
jgi:hypothetical protein